MMNTQLPQSARLADLLRTLTDGQKTALDQFWHEIETVGTPLIESVPDDDSQRLVTFLYRATHPVGSVELDSALGGRGRIKEPMSRLPLSDAWYKSYRLRPGLRTEYLLAVDGVSLPDRLNPRRLTFPPDADAFFDKTVPESWFDVPPVATPSWLDAYPDRFMGDAERVRFTSEALGNERPLTLYRSPEFNGHGRPQQLLVLFDRWIYAHVLPTLPMIDQLVAAGEIPPIFVAMVGHPNDGARGKELSCYAPFADFLARELMPWLTQRYQVDPHPARTIVGGMSAGGLAAAYVGLRYPDRFGNVLSQSGAYSWKPEAEEEYEWLTRQFVANPCLPLNWYLSVGVLETRPHEGARPNLLMANRHLRDVLRAKGYALHYVEYHGGHNVVWQLPCLAEGLRLLLGPSMRG